MSAESILEIISFNKNNFGTILNCLISSIVLIYLSLIIWAYIDASKRVKSTTFKFASVLMVAIFNIPGFLLYLLFRPSETLEEVASRKVFDKHNLVVLESHLKTCPECLSLNKSDFKYCVFCQSELVFKCDNCSTDLDPLWRFCPVCSTEIDSSKGISKRRCTIARIITDSISNLRGGMRKSSEKKVDAKIDEKSTAQKEETQIQVSDQQQVKALTVIPQTEKNIQVIQKPNSQNHLPNNSIRQKKKKRKHKWG